MKECCNTVLLQTLISTVQGLVWGIVVKFAHYALEAHSSQVWISSVNRAPLVKPCCGSIPHKIEEDWQQTLAQGQSSSLKKKEMMILISYFGG